MKGWIGTLAGAAGGFLLGGPWGALAGASLGQAWDRGWLSGRPAARLQMGPALAGLFELLGHLARADGRVSEREVAFAEQLMDRFQLAGAERVAAVQAFERGRQEPFQIDAALDALATAHRPGSAEARQLLELLVALAETDGPLVPAERGALARIAQRLGVQHNAPARQLQGWTRGAALRELGLDEGVDEQQVRAAYKRLLSRYHPDKLAAQQLSAEQRAEAQQRLQRVREAYDYLRQQPS